MCDKCVQVCETSGSAEFCMCEAAAESWCVSCHLHNSVQKFVVRHHFFCKGPAGLHLLFFHSLRRTFPSAFGLLALRCHRLSAVVFVWFPSSGSDLSSDLSSAASASVVLLPAPSLPMISCLPGQCWDEEAAYSDLMLTLS